jgi:hypothetical protein
MACALTVALGCSNNASPPPSSFGVPCTGPLSDVAGDCPAIFAGELAGLACPSAATQRSFGCPDGGAGVFFQSDGSTRVWCLYDASSHALVGVTVWAAEAEFCGLQSATETAGQDIDPACAFGAPLMERMCSAEAGDAGGDAPPDVGDAGDGGVADAVSE